MDVSRFKCSTEKFIEKGSEKSRNLKPKIQENIRKNVCERDVFFDLEISWIWVHFASVSVGFWVGFGSLSSTFSNILRHGNDFDKKLDFGGILEGSGTGLGKVLGGSLEGFGRLLRSLNAF